MLGLRSDWQEHMARSAAEIGVEGLRMHGAMDDDLSITPRKGEYHFCKCSRSLCVFFRRSSKQRLHSDQPRNGHARLRPHQDP